MIFVALASDPTPDPSGAGIIVVVVSLIILACLLYSLARGTWRANHTEDGELIEDYDWRKNQRDE